MTEKKRRFGVSEEMSTKMGQMLNIGNSADRLFRDTVIPCSRLEPDPDNPRRLAITRDDLFKDLTNLTTAQQDDLVKLQELSASIKISGLINPIVVVKNNEMYRIIAGERRFLACLLAKKEDIDARVFETKPGSYELKLIQWFENNEREDLSIIDRLDNIRSIIHAYKAKTNEKKVTAKTLGEMIGLSESAAKNYLSLLNAPADVADAIYQGKIKNVEIAALISNSQDPHDRATAIESIEKGRAVKEVKALLAEKRQTKSSVESRGARKLSLGKVNNADVLKTIVNAVIQLPSYRQYAQIFETADWVKPQSALDAFKRLINILETE